MNIKALLTALALSMCQPAYAGVTIGIYGDNTATGWTDITEVGTWGEGTSYTGSGTRKVFVANAGNDGNTGTKMAPKQTLAACMAALRNGFPDWCLAKRGDTWTETVGYVNKSGESASKPMVIGAYGTSTARPLFKVPMTAGVGVGSTGANSNGNFLAVVGIEFYAYTRDPNSADFNSADSTVSFPGVRFVNASTWLLFENCKWTYFGGNTLEAAFGGTHQEIIFRRNTVAHSYIVGETSQGIFTSLIEDFLLEENLIDHNGWNADLEGAGRTAFSHGLYSGTANYPATVRGNIFARNSSHGATMNHGGKANENLFVRNAIALHFKRPPTGVGKVLRNVIQESDDHVPGDGGVRGWGITTGTMPGNTGTLEIADNIISQAASSGGGGTSIGLTSGIVTTVTDNIIFDWATGITGVTGDHTLSGNVEDLNGDNAEGNYSDPTRTVASYNDVVLSRAATLEDFLDEAAKQSQDNWRPEYTAAAVNTWINAGFDQ